MSRLLAGVQLAAIVLFWLIAWIPMSAYCLLVIAVGPIFHRSRSGGERLQPLQES